MDRPRETRLRRDGTGIGRGSSDSWQAQPSGIVTRMGGDALPAGSGRRGSGRPGQETGAARARAVGDARRGAGLSHAKNFPGPLGYSSL
jgi:hypothetical protein